MPKDFQRPFVVCMALLVAGCGTHRVYGTQDVFNETQIEHDKYAGLTYVRGVPIGSSGIGVFQSQQIVTSLKDDGTIDGIWIDYAEGASGTSHTLYESAHDADAHALKLEKLDRQRQTRESVPYEEVAVDLTESYVRSHMHTGIEIQLEGRHGNQVVSFFPSYLEGYWPKVLTAEACVKDKSC